MAAPANPPKPSGGGGFAARLTRKVGPLPVWAWAAVILGLILVFMRFSSKNTPPAASEAPAPGPETGDASGVPSGGGTGGSGGEIEQLAQLLGMNQASLDQLTSALLTERSEPNGMAPGEAPGAVSQAGPASTPARVAPPPASSPPGTSQSPKQNVLVWDGKTFRTKSGFNAWLKARGFNAQSYLANKPTAKAIYSSLPA